MSNPLSQAPEAPLFAAALRETMARKGILVRVLAERTGIHQSNIVFYRSGRCVPSQENLARLAEALDEPALVTHGLRMRQRQCVECGTIFTATRLRGIRPIVHCSTACANRHRNRRVQGTRRNALLLAERERDALRALVRLFCEGCESDGVCRNAMAVRGQDCVFREVTPFVWAEGRRPERRLAVVA